jgi:tetratricopeptide (TPR) repeat protein
MQSFSEPTPDPNKPSYNIPGNFVDANILLLEAKQKIDSQKIKEGLDILHHLTLLYPDYARAYNLLGFVYDSLFEDTRTAEKYYKKCLNLEPDFKEVYSNYAYCLLVLKKYEVLEEFLLEAVDNQITNKPYLFHLLGKAQEALHKFDEAMEAYENSILNSFDVEDIKAREKDIERCQKKNDFRQNQQKPKPPKTTSKPAKKTSKKIS